MWAASTRTACSTCPRNPLPWHDRSFTIRARIPARPDLRGELRVFPRFDCGGGADYRGYFGTAGSSGQNGEDGGAGPSLEVALAYVETNLHGRLVLVRVRDLDRGTVAHFLVDPQAANKFVVSADGGDGGDGGGGSDGSDGSSGSSGSDGTSGSTCQDGGDGSDGGNGGDGSGGTSGGNGGYGGEGGYIRVVYPAAFPELVRAVIFSAEGGRGVRAAAAAMAATAARAVPAGAAAREA